MMTAPHMIAGAALGKTLRRPWVVLPVAFLSHFILDYVPHVEATTLFASGKEVAAGVLSTALAVGLVGWALYRRRGWPIMLGGALVAILMDAVELPPGWEKWLSTSPGTAWLYAFHHGFHHSLPHAQWVLGVSTQLTVIGIAIWAIRRKPRHQPPQLVIT